MVIKSIFIILFSFSLFALECENYKIINKANKILFYEKNKLLKKIKITSPIKKVSCLYNNLIVIVTPVSIYIASPKGELIKKQSFYTNLEFLYITDNIVFYKNENQYVTYKILKDSSIETSKILIGSMNKTIFLSKDKKKQNVFFYHNYYTQNNKEYKIIPLKLKDGKLYFFDKENKDIFIATDQYFKNKVSIIDFDKLNNERELYKKFSALNQKEKEKVISYFIKSDIKTKLFSIYIKEIQKNKDSDIFISKIIQKDGIANYYYILKKFQYIRIPNFGKYSLNNITELKNKIQNFKKSFDYKIFSKYGNFTYNLYYPQSPKDNITIKYYLDDKLIFVININPTCSLYSQKEEKGTRSKGFIFTTVIYESMFAIKKYHCKLQYNKIDTINLTLQLFQKANTFKIVKLKHQWDLTTKEVLYDISSKKTAFGKIISGAFSGSQKCDNISKECKRKCKIKDTSRDGFFIFSDSDKEKCENLCIQAKFSCNKGKEERMKKEICQAKCVGYNNANGGLFSSSDYDKCINSCLAQ